MLRRKNNDITYNQNQGNQSPIRFERKNPHLSPGLSPMRCRTPTRGNVSPFRTGGYNDNHRGHSPIKFVSNKVANPSTNGFFRQDHSTSILGNNNQKYSTYATNNDHSSRRESFYEFDNSSKVRIPHQNTQRGMIYQNTKLFSKLVSKLNSQKKKEPELTRRNTKPEAYRPTQISQYEHKSTYLQKQKIQHETLKVDPITEHIKPVESVAYEQKSTRTLSQKKIQVTVQNGKQNKIFLQQQTYKIKEHSNKTPMRQTQIKNAQKSCNKGTSDKKSQILKNYDNRISNNQQESNKKSEKSYKNERNGPSGNVIDTSFATQQNRGIIQKQEITDFDDVKMYLDKLKDSFGFAGINKDDSIGNLSDTYKNVNVSLMNMDPFI